MNGKYIIIVMLAMNIFTFLISAGFAQTDSENIVGSFYLVDIFLEDSSTADVTQIATDIQGIGLNDNFTNSVDSLTQQQAGGTVSTVAGGFTVFLDGLKIVFAVISLITPFPILAFLASLGLPLFMLITIGLPIILMYILSLVEFIRGGEF